MRQSIDVDTTRGPALGRRHLLLALALVLLSGTAAGGAAPPGGYPRVLFVGDSITVGLWATSSGATFRERFVAMLRARDPRNAVSTRSIAVSGIRTSSMLQRLMSTPPGEADLVVVELGTNDYNRSDRPISAVEQEYHALIALLLGVSPHATLMCLTLWDPPQSRPDAFGATVADYNALVRRECRGPGSPGIVVDITNLFLDPGNHSTAGTTTFLGHADDYHPGDQGHERIAQALMVALTGQLPPAAPTTRTPSP